MISVIIPIYNAYAYLDRCIQSILRQTTQENIEIILVNDGSIDNSLEICEKYSKEYPNVIVIDKKNEGVSIARKTGLDKANGDYVTFVDADDWLERDFLKKVLLILQNDSPDVLVYDYYLAFSDKGIRPERHIGYQGYYRRNQLPVQFWDSLIHDENGKQYRGSLWGNIFKTELLKKYILADKNAEVGEDAAITIAMVYNSDSIYFLPECLYNYYLGDASATRSGRVYNSKSPYVVNSFIEHNIDIEGRNFKEQLYRKITHDVFNVCCSLFNSKKSYFKICKSIQSIVDMDYYKTAIEHSYFKSMYYSLARISLKYKLCFVILIISKLKLCFLKGRY